MSKTKVLNLYAGIGGNRKLWKDVDVTAVEWDEEKAKVYRDHFPEDTVVVTDAHEYLKENFRDYEFIWASPPCPTHSQLRKNLSVPTGADPVYPDMKLYQEILLLKHSFEADWVVENVKPYYDPLINGQERGRHMLWSNFIIPSIEMEPQGIRESAPGGSTIPELEDMLGFDTTNYGFTKKKRRKVLNNCVHPELGKHVFESCGEQTTLV